MSERTYLSPEGYERLTRELSALKGPKRREVAKALEKARAHGDLRENSEYDAARDAQAHLERRISELEGKLANAKIVDKKALSSDKITIAKTVQLQDLDSGEKIIYTLVGAEEADPMKGKISVASPIGRALMGHKMEEKVEINIPAGKLIYKILKIDA